MRQSSFRRGLHLAIFKVCGLLVLLINSRAGMAQDVPLTKTCSIRFATVEQANEALLVNDAFMKGLSQFDLDSRVGKRDATRQQYQELIRHSIRPWPAADRERLSQAVARVGAQLRALRSEILPTSNRPLLPLPPTVLLVRTSGDEEGHAAYCRGNAIVLPQRKLNAANASLDRLLAHELFHVISSHNLPLRDKLYAIIGFSRTSEITLPKDLADLKITNPDAPALNSIIRLRHAESERHAVPLLYARSRYDPQSGGSFFRYLQFRLLVVQQNEQHGWEPVLEGGRPVLLDPRSSVSFNEQIGANTGYNFHADEILAENFVLFVRRSKNVKTPRILEAMGKAFVEYAHKH